MSSKNASSLGYRPDIDGLRALAVLPVVAFHAGLERFAPGGFVGVDIFFVVSGFLITRIIYDGIHAGTYSIADFYNRRARRILPALTVVFLFCALAGLAEYFPVEQYRLRSGMIAASLFGSNILFYNTSSYFDQEMATHPLLHTWSLSVEEQFYILFPIFVWLTRALSARTRLACIVALALISFVASALAVRAGASAAFYLVQYRAWELLLGALLSLRAIPTIGPRWLAESVATFGLLAILLTIALLDRSSTFPGPAALGPCLGAIALIHSGTGHRTVVGRILSATPVRFVGLISYSLYLWHWPIIVYGRLIHEPRGGADKLVLIGVSFVIATVSWRFVERPFRGQAFSWNVARVLQTGAAVIALTCLVGVALPQISRAMWRLQPSADADLAMLAYDPNPDFRVGTCFLTSEYTEVAMFHPADCLHRSDTKKNVLIVGDSHAAHLWAGYAMRFPEMNFLQATASGCRPVLPLTGEKRCIDLDRMIFSQFLPKTHVDTIILSGRWEPSDVPKAVATAASLRPYADRVIVSGPMLEYTQALPRILATASAYGQDAGRYAARYGRSEPKSVDDLFKRQTWPDGVRYASPYSALCAAGACEVRDDEGRPLQFDYGHLTKAGAAKLGGLLAPTLFGSDPSRAN